MVHDDAGVCVRDIVLRLYLGRDCVVDPAAVEIPAACGCGRGVIDNGGDAECIAPIQGIHLGIRGCSAEKSRAGWGLS